MSALTLARLTWRLVAGLTACLGLLLAGPQLALAQGAASSASYEMPGLPLSEALERFGQTFGFHVNYPEDLARGLTSRPVKSAATPQQALDQMLAGTGLTARFTRRDAFTIVQGAADARADLTLKDLLVTAPLVGRPTSQDYAWYGALVLQECFRTLRARTNLKGVKYDLQLYVWLDANGSVIRLETVSLAVEAGTRQQIEDALSSVRLVSLPPSDMPQPIGLRISAM